MKVLELMSSPVFTCSPNDTLDRAARLLWERDCGVLPVVDREGHVGAALTDRDVCMAAYTRGRPLCDLYVADAMSHELVTCRADEDVTAAASRMAEHRVRRLPVVDGDGKLLGLLSLNDLAIAGERDPALARAAQRVLLEVCRHRFPETPCTDVVLEPAAPAAKPAATAAPAAKPAAAAPVTVPAATPALRAPSAPSTTKSPVAKA